ncbi:Tfp pilus assembly protein PilF [Desulfatibacillum alkenivorans DSM 16219]|jgi:tetratricopeptide (TPR) repeat protein|uniref:Tfp pilus assembly protein PilF n=1 Tax=Desulfatibacillum alkenivorans DSM 16219 TaxID=1121393 RepID=A0A1M6C927_9BACT|nr:tetratricopeptide repeat protein [Desulfatibacillum alkenivorans]SHI57258.1 Tfp pilus assembly protein PilF [Desulfatibacillum alkenivorans DSM 16219]
MADFIATSRKAHLLILCCLTIAVFANSLESPFIWDDERLIQENPWITDAGNIPAFFSPDYWDQLHPIKSSSQYRPVRVSSFALDYAIWGENPTGYHLTNLLLHLANVVLLYFAVFWLLGGKKEEQDKGALLIPFVCALLFAVHPIHSEALNLIKNRSELLAFLFVLSALALFAKAKDRDGLPYVLYLTGALACFFLALASKETALVLPFLALWLLWVFEREKGFLSNGFQVLPMFVLLAGFAAFRLLVFESPEAEPQTALGLAAQASIIFKTIGAYVFMLVLPVNQTVDIPMPASLASPDVLIGWAFLIAAVAYGVKTWRKNPEYLFALGWIAFTLAPASNLQYLESRPLAEQRLYMPSAGYCLILGILLVRLMSMDRRALKNLGVGLTVALAAVYAWGTFFQNSLWREPVKLWTRALKHVPDSPRPWYNLGNAYMAKRMYTDAVAAFEKTLELDPGDPDALNNLACAQVSLGLLDEATANVREALKTDPNSAVAYYNLGNAMAKSNRLSEAVMYYDMAVSLKPDFPMAQCNLGYLLFKMGNPEKARERLSIALALDPENALIRTVMANVLSAEGDLEQARVHYQKALELEPDQSQIHYAYGNLLSKLGEVDQAEEQHRAALENDPEDPRFHANMANTLSRQGRYGEAMTHYEKALELEPGNAMIHTNMGIALADQGKVKEAASHFKAAMKSQPDFAPAYYNMGYVLAKQGRHQEALDYLGKAVEIKPDYGQAYYEAGNSLAHTGHLNEAVQSYKKALEQEPDNPKILHNLGIVYAQGGELETAVDYFEKALALQPNYHEAAKHLEQAKQLMESQK